MEAERDAPHEVEPVGVKPYILPALLLSSTAVAQTVTDPLSSLPADEGMIIDLGIGLLSSELTGPLTAISKRYLHVSGITTILINAVLSAIVAGGLGFARGTYGHGTSGLLSALIATVTAFIRANGKYIQQVQVHKAGLEKSFDSVTIEAVPGNAAGTFVTLPVSEVPVVK